MKIFTNLISKRIKNVIGKGSSILLLLLCCVVASAQQVEVTLTAAGTLSEKIATDQKYVITSLKVSGPINGTDVRYLREMAGQNYEGYSTSGKLAELDLTDANIVEGGDYYYYSLWQDGGKHRQRGFLRLHRTDHVGNSPHNAAHLWHRGSRRHQQMELYTLRSDKLACCIPGSRPVEGVLLHRGGCTHRYPSAHQRHGEHGDPPLRCQRL